MEFTLAKLNTGLCKIGVFLYQYITLVVRWRVCHVLLTDLEGYQTSVNLN